jgi:hypothetical protein
MSQPTTRKLYILLSLAFVFIIALAGIGFWAIRTFMPPATQIVILKPEDVQQSRLATTPPVARDTVRTSPNGTSPTFKGKVVDAVTKAPIDDFTIHLGYSYNSNNQAPYFNNTPPKDFHGGTYVMSSRMTLPSTYSWYLRIDAKGHLPIVSEPQTAGGELNFELQPGKDLQGIVLDSTGAPVAGAVVVMAVPGLSTSIDPNNIHAPPNSLTATTAADGTFTLPPESGSIAVGAITDKGYAQFDQDASADRIVLHLADWAHIKGTLTIAGKPGVNKQIQLSGIGGRGPNSAYISTNCSVQSDPTGKYHFDHVIPGTLQLCRMIQRPMGNGGYMIRQTQNENVTVAAGQSATVNLGGVGRAVVGKLIFPAGSSAKDYYLNDNINGQSAPPSESFPPQMPDNVKKGSQMGREMWMSLFSVTAAGKEFLAAHPRAQPVYRMYAMELAADNTFRIEDVVPGDYTMTFYPSSMNGSRQLMQFTTSFTVPEVPGGGYSDQPVTIPDIKFIAR